MSKGWQSPLFQSVKLPQSITLENDESLDYIKFDASHLAAIAMVTEVLGINTLESVDNICLMQTVLGEYATALSAHQHNIPTLAVQFEDLTSKDFETRLQAVEQIF